MLQLEHTTTVERLYLIQAKVYLSVTCGYYIMPELLFEKRGTTLLPAASGGVSASVFIMNIRVAFVRGKAGESIELFQER